MRRRIIITIDGPAGSGKSTAARRLANRLGFTYLDTGATYRAVTLKALMMGISAYEGRALRGMLKETKIEFRKRNKKIRIVLDSREVTALIRDTWVTEQVYRYAQRSMVRRAMVRLQRKLGQSGRIVVEGRDISTVVFPKADIKFYLDASVEERARRRFKEIKQTKPSKLCTRTYVNDPPVSYQEIRHDIKQRDWRDKHRRISPLKKARDAICVDTTKLTVTRTVDRLYKIVMEKVKI